MLKTDQTKKEEKARENYEGPTEQEFNSYLTELSAMADQAELNETDMPDLWDFIKARSADPDYHQAVISIRKPK